MHAQAQVSAHEGEPIASRKPRPAGPHVEVTANGKTLSLLDGRMPLFSPEQVAKAEEELTRKAGPIVARVWERTEESFAAVRAELNQRAGGQASARVMLLAHHALRAQQALELQTLAAARAFGDEQNDNTDKHTRTQAGLAVVATDSLNKAYAAADEEGERKANGDANGHPLGWLMTQGRSVPTEQGGSLETHGSNHTQGGSENTQVSSDPVPPLAPGGGVARGPGPSPTASPAEESR